MESAPQRPRPILLPFAAMSTQAQPRKSSLVLTALAGALLVTSCKVGPDYEEPVLEEGVLEESFASPGRRISPSGGPSSTTPC